VKINTDSYLPNTPNSTTCGLPNTLQQHRKPATVWHMPDVLLASDIPQCTGWWITVPVFLAHSFGQVPVPDIQQVHTDCHLALLLLR